MVYDNDLDRPISTTQFTNIDSYLADVRNRVRQKLGTLKQDSKSPVHSNSVVELQREVNLLRKQRHDLEVRLRHHKRIIQSDKRNPDLGSVAANEKLREENRALAAAHQAKERQVLQLQQQLAAHSRQRCEMSQQTRLVSQLTSQVEALQSEIEEERASRQRAQRALSQIQQQRSDDSHVARSQLEELSAVQAQLTREKVAAREREQRLNQELTDLRQEFEQERHAHAVELAALAEKASSSSSGGRPAAEGQEHPVSDAAVASSSSTPLGYEDRFGEDPGGKARDGDDAGKQAVRHNVPMLQNAVGEMRRIQELLVADMEVMQQAFFSDELLAHVTSHMEQMAAAQPASSEEGSGPAAARVGRDRSARGAERRLREELKAAKEEAARHQEAANIIQEELEGLQIRYEHELRVARIEGQGQAAVWQTRWQEEFEKRKRLTEEVLELKGNIRVFCRVRPLISKECDAEETVAVVPKGHELIAVDTGAGDRDYEYDRVFGPDSSQAEVFGEVQLLIDNLLDGYNCCILAYGQTGSGKTYTMEGELGEEGVNTRALEELFRLVGVRKERIGDVSVLGSMLEIYNDHIFDLLAPTKADKGLEIKEGKGGINVPDLTCLPLSDASHVADMVSRGKAKRSTFATSMNEHSSRSHLILSVYVTCTDVTTSDTRTSKLHLIDLAGSERISRSGAQGSRLKEAQAINSSLSALGDVVQALQQRKAHVPYRNSKLTRLLQDSLGGSSKTALFVNVSPALGNAAESRCSLEFAARAKKVELGAARRATVHSHPSSSPSPVKSRPARAERDTDVSSSSSLSARTPQP